jgi:hypothetical protein
MRTQKINFSKNRSDPFRSFTDDFDHEVDSFACTSFSFNDKLVNVLVFFFCFVLIFLFMKWFADLYSIKAETEASTEAAAPADGVVMDGLSAEQEKVIAESKESFVFQAEVNRLMDIIINSLCKSYQLDLYKTFTKRYLNFYRQEPRGFSA